MINNLFIKFLYHIFRKNMSSKTVDNIKNINFSSNAKRNLLSKQDIDILNQKAEIYVADRKYYEAIICYNQIIENIEPHPLYFKERAFCYRLLKDFDRAIDDYNVALKLDKDDGNTYWQIGACFNDKPYFDFKYNQIDKINILKKAMQFYKTSLEKIPTNEIAWLALMDIHFCLSDFDDVISIYGACKSYINNQKLKLIRDLYFCLALALSGEPIEDEDLINLNDKSIRLEALDWAFYSIDILFEELKQKGFDTIKLDKAKEIFRIFESHIKDINLCFKPGKKQNK